MCSSWVEGSSASLAVGVLVDVDCFLAGWEGSVEVDVEVCLRFLGLSPLKVRGFTMVILWGLELVLGTGWVGVENEDGVWR